MVFGRTLYHNVCIDPRIIFFLGKIVKKHCEAQVESGFLGGSPIFDFSVYFDYLSRIAQGSRLQEVPRGLEHHVFQ